MGCEDQKILRIRVVPTILQSENLASKLVCVKSYLVITQLMPNITIIRYFLRPSASPNDPMMVKDNHRTLY